MTRSWVGPTHCAPISTTLPSPIGSFRVRPPTRSRASRTTTSRPAARRARAAASPARPAPTTTTSASRGAGVPSTEHGADPNARTSESVGFRGARPRVARSRSRAQSPDLMRFYEYESRRIVERAGIPVTKYGFCTTADEAKQAAERDRRTGRRSSRRS